MVLPLSLGPTPFDVFDPQDGDSVVVCPISHHDGFGLRETRGHPPYRLPLRSVDDALPTFLDAALLLAKACAGAMAALHPTRGPHDDTLYVRHTVAAATGSVAATKVQVFPGSYAAAPSAHASLRRQEAKTALDTAAHALSRAAAGLVAAIAHLPVFQGRARPASVRINVHTFAGHTMVGMEGAPSRSADPRMVRDILLRNVDAYSAAQAAVMPWRLDRGAFVRACRVVAAMPAYDPAWPLYDVRSDQEDLRIMGDVAAPDAAHALALAAAFSGHARLCTLFETTPGYGMIKGGMATPMGRPWARDTPPRFTARRAPETPTLDHLPGWAP